MEREFKDYEPLKCVLCDKEFLGRKPVDGGDTLCDECIKADEHSVIDDNNVPDSVHSEVDNGRGDDDGE